MDLTRFNRWWNDAFPPKLVAAYRAMERMGGMQPKGGVADAGGHGSILTYTRLPDDWDAHRPPEYAPADWAFSGAMVNANLGKGPAGTLELWTLMGLCSGGPRLYCPDERTYQALGNTEVNVGWGTYAQPFPTFCVVVPAGCAPHLADDIGRPVAMLGRHSATRRLLTFNCFGDSGVGMNLNWYSTWTDRDVAEGETLEHRLRLREDLNLQEREGRFADPPGPFAVPLTTDENSFLSHAMRVFLNSCLLLSNYGVKDLGRSNPEYARKLEATLANRKAPDAAKRAARADLDRMPRLVGFDQEVRLWTTGGVSGDTPAGWKVRPHWRRGHYARQKHGPGRTLEKLVLRPAVLVNRELMAEGDGSEFRTAYKG
jgi:hypothetical protein